MRVIIAAAGTGGHINPGIAIANKIMQEEKNSEILFVGTSRGIEKDLVPRAGYKLETVEAYGLSKKINKDNIKKMIKTVKSVKVAEKIIKKFKPDIVIGTGGYICGPVITAANKLKIPTMLHESNSFPGLAVKMLSKKVDTIMLGFKEAKEFLKKERLTLNKKTNIYKVRNGFTFIGYRFFIKKGKLVIRITNKVKVRIKRKIKNLSIYDQEKLMRVKASYYGYLKRASTGFLQFSFKIKNKN